MNRHNAKEGRPRDGKWERNLARSGSVRGGRFSLEEDIRLPVPFVCSLSVDHRIFAHSPTVISCLVKVIRYCIRSLYSLILPLYLLFVIFIRINKSVCIVRQMKD